MLSSSSLQQEDTTTSSISISDEECVGLVSSDDLATMTTSTTEITDIGTTTTTSQKQDNNFEELDVEESNGSSDEQQQQQQQEQQEPKDNIAANDIGCSIYIAGLFFFIVLSDGNSLWMAILVGIYVEMCILGFVFIAHKQKIKGGELLWSSLIWLLICLFGPIFIFILYEEGVLDSMYFLYTLAEAILTIYFIFVYLIKLYVFYNMPTWEERKRRAATIFCPYFWALPLLSRKFILEHCKYDGEAFKYASFWHKADRDIVLAAVSNWATALKFASQDLQNDREVVLAACSQDGSALLFASEELKNNREVSLMACSQDGLALAFASDELKNDKEIVIAACSQDGRALKVASPDLQNDKEVVLTACSDNGENFRFASQDLRDDKEFVWTVCSQNGWALAFASEALRDDKEVVLAACSQEGYALQCASENLRADKEVVMTVINSDPAPLKFALGGLNQDKDCLIKVGLWDEDYDDVEASLAHPKKKIVLSTKFSLGAKSSPHATRFTVALKQRPYIKSGNFAVYSPNAFNKDTCDPNWTDKKWPCRGTFSSCQKPPEQKMGLPQEGSCCWRYSFRYQLSEASRLGGFMIQVVDRDPAKASSDHEFDHPYNYHTLGDGQAIESEMAKDVGIKIFRFFEPKIKFQRESAHNLNYDASKRKFKHIYAAQVDQFVSEIEEWYKSGQSDMSDCNVRLTPTLWQKLASDTDVVVEID